MPFWRRREVLTRTLDEYAKFYRDIEVIVVDDGSPSEQARIDRDYPWPVRVISLPTRAHALNPCVPLNIGARAAGDILVLTNPEVIHREPIFDKMRAELDPMTYVAAACISSDGRWFCHTSHVDDAKLGRVPSPPGAGLHFCSMLHKSLFDAVGGFDESYRNGQGYEDNDFLWKLHAFGVKFKILDDCLTEHLRCPPTKWPQEGALINRKIYESKWQTSPKQQSTHIF